MNYLDIAHKVRRLPYRMTGLNTVDPRKWTAPALMAWDRLMRDVQKAPQAQQDAWRFDARNDPDAGPEVLALLDYDPTKI